jgi:hypothetical protein
MANGDGTPCYACGATPTRKLPIRRHRGMIIVQQFFKIHQSLCRDHGVDASKKYLGKTLLEGWWGFVSFFVNIFVVISDIVVWLQYARLPEPIAGVAPVAPTAAVSGSTDASTGGWHSDPLARHQMRYYDGTSWTEHVSNNGVTTTDPIG